MNQKNILKTLILTAAVSLGLAASATADMPLTQPPPPSASTGGEGLLGQTYAGLTYSYIDLNNSPVNADGFTFEYNQALNTGLDAVFSYDWTQTGQVAGNRANQQGLGAALRAFSTSFAWGKPYVEAGVGYIWTKYAGVRDNSFAWEVAVGSEFQVAPAVTVTPFVQYADAPDIASKGTWDFGVKANYWVKSQWAVTAGVDRDNDHNTAFTVGTNFRF